MHEYDPYGIKHQQQMSRAADRIDALIMAAVLVVGVTVYFTAPLVAEWMERQ